MAAIISKILSSLGLGGNKNADLKARIDRIIVGLDLLRDRVAELRYRFEQRSHELMEKIMDMIRRGEKGRAYVYANELAQIKSVLKVIVATENLIIMASERLKTVRDSKELLEVMMTFGAALEEVRDQVRTYYPGIAMAFDEISRKVRSLIVETSLEGIGEVDPIAITSSAVEVLNKAMKQAEERVRRSFPEPPIKPKLSEPSLPAPSGKSGEPREAQAEKVEERRMSMEELEKRLLEYIREHGGFLDIADFTSKYGVSRHDVVKALHSLASKGLIVLG